MELYTYMIDRCRLVLRGVSMGKKDILTLFLIRALYCATCDVKHGVGRADKHVEENRGFRMCGKEKNRAPKILSLIQINR